MTAVPTYLYAVTRTSDEDLIAGLSGVDGLPVGTVRHRDLAAVTSSVPAAADPDMWQARLQMLDGVAEIARAHHAVVAAVATRAVTLPFRLACVHSGPERVGEMLRDRCSQFQAALSRLENRVELGVKVYAEPPVALAPPPANSTSPGRDYLRRRLQARDQQGGAYHRAATAATRIDATLADLAVARRQLRPQGAPLSGVSPGGAGENVLNVAYLVEAARVERFTERAKELGAGLACIRVEVTGPWAAYSFAATEEEPDG